MTEPTAPDRAAALASSIRGSLGAIGDALRPAVLGIARFGRTIGRALRPVLATVGPIGWIVLAAAALLLAAGLALAWAEFVFLALTLVGAFVIAGLYLIGRASYRVEVDLRPRRVVVGERALGALAVTSTARGRSTPSRMELPVGRGIAEFSVPSLGPGESHEELFAVPTQRRAVIPAGPAMTVRGDHLGLLRRVVRWTGVIELFVHPLTARLHPSAAGLLHDLEGETTRVVTDHDISFHALRPYQRGDALRNVHWRTSARVGQLMVRQYEETRRNELLLAIATDREGFADEDEFELAVSVFASVAVQVIADGTRITAVGERGRLRTVSRQALLDDSCRLEPTRRAHARLRDFARVAHHESPRPSVAMMVTGSRVEVAALRSAFAVFGDETHSVALSVRAGAAPSIAVVGGVTVATIGSLTELSRVLRKVHP